MFIGAKKKNINKTNLNYVFEMNCVYNSWQKDMKKLHSLPNKYIIQCPVQI